MSERFYQDFMSAFEASGLTKAELHRKSGVSYDIINKLVRGDNRSTRPDRAIALAKALGFTLPGSSQPEIVYDGGIQPQGSDLISVHDVSASAGPGTFVDGEEYAAYSLAFPPGYLSKLTRANPKNLAIISVKGESMAPTLHDDDIVMLDTSKTNLDYDGLFVLRFGETLHVKRVTRSPAPDHIKIISDNRELYPAEDWPADQVTVVGKVIWKGGKV